MRLFWKPALLLTLLFAALVGLIRAQPYDDSELRAFLTPPDGCPMPCFMGIRPGVTTMEEAVRILEAHEWVGEINVDLYPDGSGNITWAWNGHQPYLIDKDRDGRVGIYWNGIVSTIGIHTRFAFGDFLLWQNPDQGGLLCGSGVAAGFGPELSGIFADYANQVEITALIPDWREAPYCPVMGDFCSLTIHDFYSMPVNLKLGQRYLPAVDFDLLVQGLGCNYYEYVEQ